MYVGRTDHPPLYQRASGEKGAGKNIKEDLEVLFLCFYAVSRCSTMLRSVLLIRYQKQYLCGSPFLLNPNLIAFFRPSYCFFESRTTFHTRVVSLSYLSSNLFFDLKILSTYVDSFFTTTSVEAHISTDLSTQSTPVDEKNLFYSCA